MVQCGCKHVVTVVKKKNDAMHQLKLAISSNAPYHVVKAYCSCVASCSGMCSHVVGLLKQLIHYVMMKLQSVPCQSFPALPLNITENVPCVFNIRSEEEHTQLSLMNLTLDEAHTLEQSTCLQSQSTKWKESRVEQVTASRFGDVLLWKSPPTTSFINTFLILASIQLFQLPLIMAFRTK